MPKRAVETGLSKRRPRSPDSFLPDHKPRSCCRRLLNQIFPALTLSRQGPIIVVSTFQPRQIYVIQGVQCTRLNLCLFAERVPRSLNDLYWPAQ